MSQKVHTIQLTAINLFRASPPPIKGLKETWPSKSDNKQLQLNYVNPDGSWVNNTDYKLPIGTSPQKFDGQKEEHISDSSP